MNLLTLKENPHLLDIPGRVFPPDPLIEVEDEEHFEVKYIKDSRRYHCQIKYLVKWKGYENLNEPIKICGTISTSSMISPYCRLVSPLHHRILDKHILVLEM